MPRTAFPPPLPPPPPAKSRKGLYILLGVLAGLGFLALFAVLVVAQLLSAIVSGSTTTSSAPVSLSVLQGGNAIALLRIDDTIQDPTVPLEIIRHYKNNSRVKGLLLRIDSPGGAVGASQEIYDAIRDLRKSGRTVVASLGNVAASGGYYIACAADEIVANPGVLTGSIGVIFSVPNIEGISEKVGIHPQVIKSGKYKDIGSMSRTMTEEEKQLLQGVIDDTYNQFLEAILACRTPQIAKAASNQAGTGEAVPQDPAAYLRTIADGRVFTGRQALSYGLVDRLGSQSDALDRLAEKYHLDNPVLYEYKPRSAWRDFFKAEADAALEKAGVRLGNGRLEYRLPF